MTRGGLTTVAGAGTLIDPSTAKDARDESPGQIITSSKPWKLALSDEPFVVEFSALYCRLAS
jgi:hypothetical protein